jgi:hypothetical protein
MGPNSVLGRCSLNFRITPESGRIADIAGRLKSARNGPFWALLSARPTSAMAVAARLELLVPALAKAMLGALAWRCRR